MPKVAFWFALPMQCTINVCSETNEIINPLHAFSELLHAFGISALGLQWHLNLLRRGKNISRWAYHPTATSVCTREKFVSTIKIPFYNQMGQISLKF